MACGKIVERSQATCCRGTRSINFTTVAGWSTPAALTVNLISNFEVFNVVYPNQYTFVTNNSGITITRYVGSSNAVTVPDMLGALPVNVIGIGAFEASSVTSVVLGDNITDIGNVA